MKSYHLQPIGWPNFCLLRISKSWLVQNSKATYLEQDKGNPFSPNIYFLLTTNLHWCFMENNMAQTRKRPKFRFGVRLILAGSVRHKFCRTFCHSISCSLTIYGYKADRLCNSLQQIVFSVTAKFHNTYLDNSVLRCKTFGLLRGKILYSCFDFIVLAKLYMLRLRFSETWHFIFLILSNRAIAAIVLSALIN